MVFRKPYAFLIKNFRKIHILMLLLVIYVYFKHIRLLAFVRNYVALQSYNSALESIDKYIGFLPYLAILLILVITGLLIYLFLYKKKPWKLYLIIISAYVLMFIGFNMAGSYFHNYDANSTIAGAMAVRDVLFIASLLQYPVLVILIIRITGIDMSRFDFAHDEEFMSLSAADREEFEINIDIDKESFKRGFKRVFRNLNYFYQEHKYIVRLLSVIIVGTIGLFAYYNIFIVNKVYKEGAVLKTLDYAIKINKSYFTNTNYQGEKISKNNFVILDLTVKNNGASRTMNVERFHIVNKNSDQTNTYYYNKEFRDLGTPYESFELKRDKEKRFLLIYKVGKTLEKDNFSLYYQTVVDGTDSKLIKMKLNLEDVSNVKTMAKVKLGEEQKLEELKGTTEEITISDCLIDDSFSYNYYSRFSDDTSGLESEDVTAKTGQKIMKLEMITSSLDNQDLVDFSLMYGKIKYEDSKGKKKDVALKNAIEREYFGNNLYLIVPDDITKATKIDFIFTLRNRRYIYNLK